MASRSVAWRSAVSLSLFSLLLAGCLSPASDDGLPDGPTVPACEELAGAPCGPGLLQPFPGGSVPDGWLCTGRFGISVLGDEARELHMEFWRDAGDGRGLRWDLEGYPGTTVQHIRTLVDRDGVLETWDHWSNEPHVEGFVKIDPYERIRVRFLMASIQHGDDAFLLGVNETDELRYVLYEHEDGVPSFISAIPSGRIAWRSDGSTEEPDQLTYDDHTAGRDGGVAFVKWSGMAVLAEPEAITGATTCPPVP